VDSPLFISTQWLSVAVRASVPTVPKKRCDANQLHATGHLPATSRPPADGRTPTAGLSTGFLPGTGIPRVFFPTGFFFCLPVTDLVCLSEHEEHRLLTGFVLPTSQNTWYSLGLRVSNPVRKWVKFPLKKAY
jgi:hypothetical protein